MRLIPFVVDIFHKDLPLNIAPLVEQQKIYRIFRLLFLLKSPIKKNLSQLAEALEVSKRTIQRYVELLEALGYNIDHDFENRFFIFDSDKIPSLHFTPQETTVLKRMIQALPDKHPLKANLSEKLYSQSSVEKLGTEFYKMRVSKLLSQLEDAIGNRKKVIIGKYHSAQGNSVQDRLVSPFRITDDFQYLIAREETSDKVKNFKIERMTEVVALEETFVPLQIQEEWLPDIFGVSGKSDSRVIMKMKLRAYLLLREEVPGAIPFLRRERNEEGTSYIFDGPVKSWDGISRFIKGLPEDICVVQPKELIDFLERRNLQLL